MKITYEERDLYAGMQLRVGATELRLVVSGGIGHERTWLAIDHEFETVTDAISAKDMIARLHEWDAVPIEESRRR